MIKFYFSETSRLFKRSPFASIIVISITTIAILLASISFYLIYVSNQLSNSVKKNIELVAYLEEPIDSAKLVEAKNQISSLKFISSVKHITKEEALKEFIRDTGEDINSVLGSNPLPQSFLIKLKPELLTKVNIDPEVQMIKAVPGISGVDYENEFVVKLLRYLKSGQMIVYIIALSLILLSIYLVYVYSKLQFKVDENLYRTMKLVGAKLRTLKLPILIYGIMVGLISSIVSLCINLMFLYAVKSFVAKPDFQFVLKGIFIISLGMGILLGFLGSYLSAKKITLYVGDKKIN